jgi:hypothetical protein
MAVATHCHASSSGTCRPRSDAQTIAGLGLSCPPVRRVGRRVRGWLLLSAPSTVELGELVDRIGRKVFDFYRSAEADRDSDLL